MIKIVNPNFELKENNIFNFRIKDWSKLLYKVRETLKPIEELGYILKSFQLKKGRYFLDELNNTIKDKLEIIFTHEEKELFIDLSLYLPTLLDGKYFLINGIRKIPLFQFFDIPFVQAKNEAIKIKTNCLTMSLALKKDPPFVRINIFKRSIPLALIFLTKYSIEELKEKFNLENIQLNTNYDKFLYDLNLFIENSQDYTKDDFIKELGRIYVGNITKNKNISIDFLSKGNEFLYILELLLKCDLSSKEFFKTDSIIEECLLLLNMNNFNDKNLINRRIRFIEYIILNSISKNVFDFCITNKNKKKVKFNVNSKSIISECNVSSIVQTDFCINPIDEITKLTRISLLGPGGFNKDNVPEHLRDIDQSMFGRICPVDTPDRENCGVLHSILPNTELTLSGQFTENIIPEQSVSPAISLVPFLENTDQTRLQMVASQMRQAILLKNFDMPYICSSTNNTYTDKSKFIYRAKKDGEIIYKNLNYIIVKYNDNTSDIFNISIQQLFMGNMNVFKVYMKIGDKFKKNDIIAESLFSKEGNIVFGKNLLTAIMPYYGYNYEDGIVISDELVNHNILTSYHIEDLSFTVTPDKVLLNLNNKKDQYSPVPIEQDWILKNEIYAKIRQTFDPLNFGGVFSEPTELKSKHECFISSCNIYANEWNKEITEYSNWIESKIFYQRENEKKLLKEIGKCFKSDELKDIIRQYGLNKFSRTGKYRNKGEVINGVFFEIKGIMQRKIQLGDKLGNVYGSKGVVSNIIPKDKMPTIIINGEEKKIDIIINPLSIISRMNVGQLFELHMTVTLFNLKNKMKEMLNSSISQSIIKDYLLNYIKIIDNTKNNWYFQQMYDNIKDIEIDEKFIDELFLIAPPFESTTYQQLFEAKKYTNSSFKFDVFDPIQNSHLYNKVACGWMYFFRMVHIAEEKMAYRGIGKYTKRTLQPVKGKRNKGGQRLGEMEAACIIGYDANKVLNEFFTTKSDCIDLKNAWLKQEITGEIISNHEELDIMVESSRLLKSYLKIIGIN